MRLMARPQSFNGTAADQPRRLPHSQALNLQALARPAASAGQNEARRVGWDWDTLCVSVDFLGRFRAASVTRTPLHHRRTRGADAGESLVAKERSGRRSWN